MKTYTLKEIAKRCDAKLVGRSTDVITGVAPLGEAGPGQVSFLALSKYRHLLPDCLASAVIVTEADAQSCNTAALVVENPELSFIQVAELFLRTVELPKAIHPTAVIGEGCQIDPSVAIGPHCVIGDRVTIGPHTQILPGTVLGNDVAIGESSLLHANVTLYDAVKVGDRAIIHSGAVLGSDGFGLAQDNGQWRKIPQLGTVVLGDDVEIGANTTIDCGALGDTVIANGVKLDNQIQVAHNVKIGENTAIAAQVGIAGSTTIGKNCMIAGKAAINGHIHIGDGVILTATTAVNKSVDAPGIYASGMPLQDVRSWRRNVVRFGKLNDMYKRLKKLEKEVLS